MNRGVALAAALVAAAFLAGGCGATKTVTKTVTVAAATAKTGLGPPKELVEYGHIRSLKPHGRAYTLRFDPAWFTSGKTANQAALEDTGSSDVPNDNYVVEEGHRLLTYKVPADAHVTVLTQHGTGPLGETPIGVAELSRIVNGGPHRKLFEPLESGIWITVRIDTVTSIDQQYRP